MTNTTILLLFLGFGLYGLLNAIYALKSPEGFLKAKWTAKRHMELDDVRFMGLIFALITGFCFWCTYVTLREIINAGRS